RPPASTRFPYTTLFRSGFFAESLGDQGFWLLANAPPDLSVDVDQIHMTDGLTMEAVLPFGAARERLTPRIPLKQTWKEVMESPSDRKSTRLNSSHVKIS